MAALEPVHVLEQDRATARMEVTKINPTRSWAELGPSGIRLVTYQNGRWFGQGGQEIDAELVPQAYRDAIEASPVTVETRGPSVVTTCEFCGLRMNRSEKEQHLIEHVRETLAAAGAAPPAPSPAKEKTRAA